MNRLIEIIRSASKREKILLGIAVFVFIIFITFIVSTIIGSSLEKKRRRIANNQKRLDEIIKISKGYQDAKRAKERLYDELKKTKNLSLFPIIETAAEKEGIKIENMNEKTRKSKDKKMVEKSVDVKIEAIGIEDFLRLAKKIESSGSLVRITTIKMNRSLVDEKKYKISFTVSTYYLED